MKLAAAFVVLTTVAVAVAAYVSAVPPSEAVRAPGWDDTSARGHSRLVAALAEAGTVRVLESTLLLLPSDAGLGDTLFLFPTNRPPLSEELGRVEAFVQAGGTLVIAADGFHADSIAARLGHRFIGLPVLLAAGSSMDCVRVDFPLGPAVVSACLPSPSALPRSATPADAGAGPFDLVANSTDDVVLDLDKDGRLSLGDQGPGRFTVGAMWQRGDGHVLLIADGEIWRNDAVLVNAQNLALARQAVNPETGGTVYLDATGAIDSRADVVLLRSYRALLPTGTRLAVTLAMAVLASVSIVLATPHAERWNSHRPSLDEGDAEIEEPAHQQIDRFIATSTIGTQPESNEVLK